MKNPGASIRQIAAGVLVVVIVCSSAVAQAQSIPATSVPSGAPNALALPPAADPSATDTTLAAPKTRPLLTLGEVVGVNVMIWSYNRYLRQGGENPGFRIGFNSWEENFKNGFEWDDNNFTTNQFAHPYHGNLYFNAARANGYDFWTSIPFAFTGSFLWEHMFETHHPSYNDWVATSVGGTTLGEMLYRLSDLVLDNTATGGERRLREVGGLLLNPMRGFNRLVTGEWSDVGPNPPGYRPTHLSARFDGGLRTLGQDHVYDGDTTRVFLDIQGQYGDLFLGDPKKPFDMFEFGFQINFGDASALAGVQARGLLYNDQLYKSPTTEHQLALFLNFDYHINNAYSIGGQSAGAGIVSRFSDTPLGEIETRVNLNPIILAGVSSDYESYTGRAYDYGPGLNAGIGAALRRNNRPWLVLNHSQSWIRTMNGTDGDHHISISRVRFDQPINENVGLGALYLLYLAENDYEELEDTSSRSPELRFFVSFPLN